MKCIFIQEPSNIPSDEVAFPTRLPETPPGCTTDVGTCTEETKDIVVMADSSLVMTSPPDLAPHHVTPQVFISILWSIANVNFNFKS